MHYAFIHDLDVKKMKQKESMVISFAGVVLLLSVAESSQSRTTLNNKPKSSGYLTIPTNEFQSFFINDNRKSSQNIDSLERELTLLRKEVGEINAKLDTIKQRKPLVRGKEFKGHFGHAKTIGNLFDTTSKKHYVDDWDAYVTDKQVIARFLTSILEENFQRFKAEIISDLHDKLKEDLPLLKSSKRKKRDTEKSETGDYEFMNIANGFETDNIYDNDFQYSGTESALDRQLNKLTRMIEAELGQYKTTLNTDDSAVNNELPETRSIVQSDGQFGLSIEKIFDMLRSEVRNALQQQSRNVKITLNKHLDSVETKMTQILTLMEGMKSSYDKKFNNLLPTSITNGNRRIEQIETNIAGLERGLASLRENLIADPNIQEHLQQIHDKLQEELSKTVHPVKRNMHELQIRIQTNMRQQGVIETSLQNFKADMREKVHFMAQDITKLEGDLKEINTSVSSEQKKGNIYTINETQIMDAVTFVEEIRVELPFIWANISSLQGYCSSEYNNTKLEISSIAADIDTLNQNQTEVKSNLQEFQSSLSELSTRIRKMKQVNIKLALEYDEWVEYNFKHTLGRSSCFGGKKYIKKTKYPTGRYVGVMLCSATKYKIYLSDDIGEKFLDIGDSRNFGEDHCEFVGGTRSNNIKVAKASNWFRRVIGYKRANWGDRPVKGVLSFFTPSPPWYQCGVSIP